MAARLAIAAELLRDSPHVPLPRRLCFGYDACHLPPSSPSKVAPSWTITTGPRAVSASSGLRQPVRLSRRIAFDR
jgi:hypothetical protein